MTDTPRLPAVIEPYRRPLSPTERVWLVADRLCPPFVNQLVLEGDGALEPGPWRAAMAVAAAANPGARVRLRGFLGRTYWVDSGDPPPVRVVDGSGWTGRTPEGAPFLLDPLDPRRGPTTELLLVGGAPSRVILRTHHAVMDGRGTLAFAEDLFHALRQEPVVGHIDTVTDLDLSRRLGGRRQPPPREVHLAPTGAPTGVVARAGWWHRVTLPGRPSRLLPRLACAIAAAARSHGEGPVRVDVPVDLRPSAPGVRSTANLTGILPLEISPAHTPEDVQGVLRAALDRHAEADYAVTLEPLRGIPVGLMAWVGRAAARKCHRRARYGSSAVLSNLGVLPLERFAAEGIWASGVGWFLPPAGLATTLFVALSGHAGGVEICASAPDVLAGGARLEALLESLVARLGDVTAA